KQTPEWVCKCWMGSGSICPILIGPSGKIFFDHFLHQIVCPSHHHQGWCSLENGLASHFCFFRKRKMEIPNLVTRTIELSSIYCNLFHLKVLYVPCGVIDRVQLCTLTSNGGIGHAQIETVTQFQRSRSD